MSFSFIIMKKTLRTLTGIATLLALALASGCASAPKIQESKDNNTPKPEQTEVPPEVPSVSGTVKTGYVNKYLSRGFALSLAPVVQTTASATYGNASIIGFSNYDTRTGSVNELDATLDITKPVGSVTLSAGGTVLTFPNTKQKTTFELYGSASLDTLLKPTFTIVHDPAQGKGTVGILSVSHALDIGKLDFAFDASVFYNDHYFRPESGLSNIDAGASVAIPLGKLNLTPTIRHSEALGKGFTTETYGGVSVSFDFGGKK